MSGGWFCCCETSCIVASDNFDRTPSTDIGGVLLECLVFGDDWAIQGSSRPQYAEDSTLNELTGAGVVLSRHREITPDQYVQYETRSEEHGQLYQIYLKVEETVPRSCNMGAHLRIDYYVGDGGTDLHAITAYNVDAEGNGTELGTVTFGSTVGMWNGDWHGRQFHAVWIAEHNLLCAGVSHVTVPGYHGLVIPNVADSPAGKRVGVGNGSGSLAIEIDNFEWSRLVWPDAPEGTDPICFSCLCKCRKYDAEDNLIESALFPPTMYMRMQGQCCTPVMTPCDTTGCPDAIDETIQLDWTVDYPSPGMSCWLGTATICDHDFEFRVVCDSGPGTHPQLSVCLAGPYGSCFDDTTGAPDGPVEIGEGYTCFPLLMVFTQNLGSLNIFPCCMGCTGGTYTYTITE